MTAAPAFRLTPPRLAVLRAVAAGRVYCSQSLGTLYKSFDRDTGRDVTRQVEWLAGRDPRLVSLGERSGFARPWSVTDAGREWLAEHDKEAAK